LSEPLPQALARVRSLLLDDRVLVRAVASGRHKGQTPRWRKVEMRYVDLKAGRHFQITSYDDTQAHTSNHLSGDAAAQAVDDVLEEPAPLGNWHVETVTETHQIRVTKNLEAMVHTSARQDDLASTPVGGSHDRQKSRLLPEDDPVLRAVGISDEQGRIKPSRQAKYRQVEEFLRALAPAVDDALSSGRLRTPTAAEPLRVVDLGCGNAYLTFAAHRYLSAVRGLDVHLTGVDVKSQSFEHNSAVAANLGITDSASIPSSLIASNPLISAPNAAA